MIVQCCSCAKFGTDLSERRRPPACRFCYHTFCATCPRGYDQMTKNSCVFCNTPVDGNPVHGRRSAHVGCIPPALQDDILGLKLRFPQVSQKRLASDFGFSNTTLRAILGAAMRRRGMLVPRD